MAIDEELMEAAAGQKKGEDPSGWDDEEQDLSDPTRLDVGQQVDDIDPVVGDGTEDEAPPAEASPPNEEVDVEALYEQDGGQEDMAAAQAELEGVEDEAVWTAPFAREAKEGAEGGVQELRDEILSLRRELAGQAQAKTAEPDFERERAEFEGKLDELWADREKFELDGDTAKSRQTGALIRKAERELSRIDVRELTWKQSAESERMAEETRGELARNRAQATLDETRQELLDVHPVFDRSSKSFDPAMEKEALRLYKAFYNAGDITASQALRDAVGYVTSAAKPARTGKQIDAERSETARRRNAAAAPKSGSPARKGVSSAKAGRNGPLPTPSKMSDRELRALTPAARAKLRGDIV